MVERLRDGWSVAQVAAAFGVCPKTVRKWRDRFATEGEAGLRDHSSRPHRGPHRVAPETAEAITGLRRQRRSGPAIARRLGLPGSTVGLVLRRAGLGRLRALEPRPESIRYERERPGELIHLDIKKLGRIDGLGHRVTGDRRGQSGERGTGREYLFVAVDDASRLAFTALMPDERKESAVAFLDAALARFQGLGVAPQRIMADNGSAFRSKLFAEALASHGLKHRRTRPYTPRTNGKAERFIQTSLREWAYAQPFETSAQRAEAMPTWLGAYNRQRPHTALSGKPPISRLPPRDNLLGNDS